MPEEAAAVVEGTEKTGDAAAAAAAAAEVKAEGGGGEGGAGGDPGAARLAAERNEWRERAETTQAELDDLRAEIERRNAIPAPVQRTPEQIAADKERFLADPVGEVSKITTEVEQRASRQATSAVDRAESNRLLNSAEESKHPEFPRRMYGIFRQIYGAAAFKGDAIPLSVQAANALAVYRQKYPGEKVADRIPARVPGAGGGTTRAEANGAPTQEQLLEARDRFREGADAGKGKMGWGQLKFREWRQKGYID